MGKTLEDVLKEDNQAEKGRWRKQTGQAGGHNILLPSRFGLRTNQKPILALRWHQAQMWFLKARQGMGLECRKHPARDPFPDPPPCERSCFFPIFAESRGPWIEPPPASRATRYPFLLSQVHTRRPTAFQARRARRSAAGKQVDSIFDGYLP